MNCRGRPGGPLEAFRQGSSTRSTLFWLYRTPVSSSRGSLDHNLTSNLVSFWSQNGRKTESPVIPRVIPLEARLATLSRIRSLLHTRIYSHLCSVSPHSHTATRRRTHSLPTSKTVTQTRPLRSQCAPAMSISNNKANTCCPQWANRSFACCPFDMYCEQNISKLVFTWFWFPVSNDRTRTHPRRHNRTRKELERPRSPTEPSYRPLIYVREHGHKRRPPQPHHRHTLRTRTPTPHTRTNTRAHTFAQTPTNSPLLKTALSITVPDP